MRGQGRGRHSAAEIDTIGCRDVTAIADVLGETPYMLGQQSTSLDTPARAVLANLQ